MKKLFMTIALVVSFNANAIMVMPHISSPHISEAVGAPHEAPVMDSDHPVANEKIQSNPVYYTPHGTYVPQSSVSSTPQQQIDGWHDTDWLFYTIILSLICCAIGAWFIMNDDN